MPFLCAKTICQEPIVKLCTLTTLTVDIQIDGFVIHPNRIDSNASEFSGVKWMENILNHQLGSRPFPEDAILSLVLVKDACFVLLQLAHTTPNSNAIFEPLHVRKWRFAFRPTKELYVLRSVHRCLCCEVDDLWGLVIWNDNG